MSFLHRSSLPINCIRSLLLQLYHSLYSVSQKSVQNCLSDRGVGDSLVVGVGGARGTSRHFCGIRIEEKQFCCCGRNRIEGKPIAAGRRALLISPAATVSDSPDFNYIPNYTSFLMLIALF